MLSIFAFMIILLNAVLALPSPRRESSASASDIVPIDATGEINEVRGSKAALYNTSPYVLKRLEAS